MRFNTTTVFSAFDASKTQNNIVFSEHTGLALQTLGATVAADLNGEPTKQFHPTKIVVKISSITNVPNGDAQIAVGITGASSTEILPATILTGCVAANNQFEILLSNFFVDIGAADTVTVTVVSADTGAGATAVATVRVEGTQS